MDIYVARQPIFDKEYKVVAYELLYRDSGENIFRGQVADNIATSILLVNSYFSFGIDNLVGKYKAFINFDSKLIKAGVAELLSNEKVVIEILETVEPDKKLLEQMKKLKNLGYTLAIDDYTTDYKYMDITELCDIVKVDFIENSQTEIELLVEELKKSNKMILAEKVETKEEFKWAKSLGFDFYQGFYFSKPTVKKRKTLSNSALQYIQLMNELNKPVPNFKELSSIILMDISLTYKLLKLVNSKSRLKNEITSIKQGITILGVKTFSKWLSLAMIQTMSIQETSEAVKYAMIRSNLLTEIALHSDLKEFVEEVSLLGTLSMIDTILEMDMSLVMESIPISEEMKDTLLGKKTKYRDVMELCYAYERGVFKEARNYALSIKYDFELLSKHYIDSVTWADNIFDQLKN